MIWEALHTAQGVSEKSQRTFPPHQTKGLRKPRFSEKDQSAQLCELHSLLGNIVIQLERLEQELWVQDSQELHK